MNSGSATISSLINPFLSMIQASPGTYLVFAAALFCLLVIIPLTLVATGKTMGRTGTWLYAMLVLITTLCYRLPFLPLTQLSVDESAEIAAARTLLHDPVFWRSVDLGTHGPLITYPLMLPHLLGVEIDFASARLLGLGMLLLSLWFIFSLLRRVSSGAVAAIAALPLVAFICMTDYWDFIAYNGEHPVILITAALLFLTERTFRLSEKKQVWSLFLTGVVMGSAPFTKIQIAPILLAIFITTLLAIRSLQPGERLKAMLIYCTGCCTFAAGLLVYLVAFGLVDEFKVRFLLGQFNYTQEATNKVKVFLETISVVNKMSWNYFILVTAAIILFSVLLGWYQARLRQPGNRALTGNFPASSEDWRNLSIILAITFMSLLAVYVPGRPFRHYYLLLVFPLGVLAGYLFVMTDKLVITKWKKGVLALLFLLLTVAGQYGAKYLTSPYGKLILAYPVSYEALTYNSSKRDAYKKQREMLIVAALRKYAAPGEKMAMWGWGSKYYVASGLIIACKTIGEQIVFNQFGNRDYYLNTFMAELEKAEAPVFLDAVAPSQFRFVDRAKQGFERFPQLYTLIMNNYTCQEEIDGVRIYVSKKRLAELAVKSFRNM